MNASEIIDLIIFNSEIFAVNVPKTPICRDPDDDKFLMCALSSKAKYIVTGDKALLDLDGYEDIKIIKPGPFAKIFA
ncbi:MAG: putative toxin-antitoxin system toxin component, PIN family [Pseudobdellovibrionaceae bacterium]